MKVEKKALDGLNAELKVTIEKADYLPAYNEKLKSYQAKSHMKGFRKGKTPMGMIKKMYGSATMQESISKLLSEKINEVITGDEFDVIGEPILKNEEELPEVDHNNPQDYVYEFELGLEPEFEVKGVDEKDSYTRYKVKVDAALIDEEIMEARRRLGNQETVDEPIAEGDIVHFDVREMTGKAVKENGVTSHFSIPLDRISDKYRKSLKGKKAGTTVAVNIFELEKNVTRDYVLKYFLKLDENESADNVSDKFEAEVKEVVRVTPADLDKEFFNKYFGEGQVESEEEARAKIEEYTGQYFDKEATNLLNREIMEALMDKNKVPLPEEFLRKWLSKDQDFTEEQFENFKKELKWRIIKKKLVARFAVEVKEEEIFQYFVNAVRNYSPYIDENSLKNTVFSLMQNKEQLNSAVENISSGKLFDAIREEIKIKEKSIDKEGFYKKVKSVNQKAQ